MKRALYIITLLAVGATSYFVGTQGTRTTAEASVETGTPVISIPDGYISMDSEAFKENYIALRTVTGYSGTETGLMLYTEDGNGYYLETPLIK